MAIKVVPQDDVVVTESDLRKYKDEYRKFTMFYCGTPPSLEEYIRSQQGYKLH